MEAPTEERWDTAELGRAAAYLSDLLEGNEVRQHDVQEILQDRIGYNPVTGNSIGELFEALELYLDADFAGFLLGYMNHADQEPDLLKDYDAALESETAIYLRKLLALFGPQVTEAHAVADQNPKAWRSFDRELYFDQLTSSWKVNLTVFTYAGEAAYFAETPNSILILARGLLDTVILAAESGGKAVLDAYEIDELLSTVEDLKALTAGNDEPVEQ